MTEKRITLLKASSSVLWFKGVGVGVIVWLNTFEGKRFQPFCVTLKWLGGTEPYLARGPCAKLSNEKGLIIFVLPVLKAGHLIFELRCNLYSEIGL